MLTQQLAEGSWPSNSVRASVKTKDYEVERTSLQAGMHISAFAKINFDLGYRSTCSWNLSAHDSSWNYSFLWKFKFFSTLDFFPRTLWMVTTFIFRDFPLIFLKHVILTKGLFNSKPHTRKKKLLSFCKIYLKLCSDCFWIVTFYAWCSFVWESAIYKVLSQLWDPNFGGIRAAALC